MGPPEGFLPKLSASTEPHRRHGEWKNSESSNFGVGRGEMAAEKKETQI